MYRMMIVDDERIEREALKCIIARKLPQIGEIEEASNGLDAVAKSRQKAFDIILMDIEMPALNGLETAQIISRESQAKIIFLTAYDTFDYAREAIKIGATDFLIKPVSDTELLNVLLENLKKVKSERQARQELEVLHQDLAYYKEHFKRQGKVLEEEEEDLLDRVGKIKKDIETYIEANYMQEISLQELAEMMNFSIFYFSKLFKQYFHKNFIDYLSDIRIQKAREMLKEPTVSVKEVGVAIGYGDPNYFTKIFKKKVGVTPTEYRNALKYET